MNKGTFLREYGVLKKKFPKQPQTNIGSENCDWCDLIFESSNCYYTFDGAMMEDCLYCYDAHKEVGDVDCTFCTTCEGCYDSLDMAFCNNCYFTQFADRSYNLWYCYSLIDCHDCFGCSNLNNKSYCIFNVQYTKEEYDKKLIELKRMPRGEVEKKLEELKKKFPRLHSDYFNNENSEYCDYAYFDSNLYYGFDSTDNEDGGYLTVSHYCKNVWDGTYAFQSEQSAEVRDSSDCYNCYDVHDCGRCYDSFYLYRCLDCHNCFGCVELAHKQYCILNVQYTKEEYEQKLIELKNDLGLKFQEQTA